MKIACELCGGILRISEDGHAVCQGCGVEYSPGRIQQMLKGEGKSAPAVSSEIGDKPLPQDQVGTQPVKEDEDPIILVSNDEDVVIEVEGEVIGGKNSENPAKAATIPPQNAPPKRKSKGKAKEYVIPVLLCLMGIGLSRSGGFFPMLLGTLMCVAGAVIAITHMRKK